MSSFSSKSLVEILGLTRSQVIASKNTEYNSFRTGIGTDRLDFAVVQDGTNIVNNIYVGYADTSKNPTNSEIGFAGHYTVGIGSTYRGTFNGIDNQCLVRLGWKYTQSSGFYDAHDYTEEWTAGLRQTRDKFLLESDWSQGADSPLSSSKKTEWATYRQALRDLPANTSDLANPPWPTKPS